MKKVDLLGLILFATIVVLSYKCYLLYEKTGKLSYEANQSMQKVTKYRQEVLLNARFETYAGKNSYVDIFQNNTNFLDTNFKNVNKDSLLRKTKMVMRIPSGVCNPCYDSIYAILLNKIPKKKINKFIILVDLNTLKDYKVYFKELGLSKNIFGTRQGLMYLWS